jgi:hypothetical protein
MKCTCANDPTVQSGTCTPGTNYEEYSDDAYRYFDDVYIDTTLSRVVLANSQDYDQATVIEPQIPLEWSDGSITVQSNLGKLGGPNMYLFVFDDYNQRNAVGYTIELDGPMCGDGICGGEENCTTCSLDCGECISCVHGADQSPCDGTVSIAELIDYVMQWHMGNVIIQDLMEAISAWKS